MVKIDKIIAKVHELTNAENRFSFDGKIYTFFSWIGEPSITMVAEDGSKFTFGATAPIAEKFILLCPNDDFQPPGNRPATETKTRLPTVGWKGLLWLFLYILSFK